MVHARAHALAKQKGRERAEDAGLVTTSYLLENLHCPSCVSSIKDILQETCQDDIIWVSPNIVTSVVTVEHKRSERASVRNMAKALEDIGFDIEAVTTTATEENDDGQLLDRITQADPGEHSRDIVQSPGTIDGWLWSHVPKVHGHDREAKDQAHLENCEACRLGQCHSPERKEEPTSTDASAAAEKGPLGQQDGRPKSTQISARPSVAELESVDFGMAEPTWRATFAVGGMTCAVCVNTITEELSKWPWISNVAVNLVSNSATVDFIGEGKAAEVIDGIEGLGYEATLDNVVNLSEKPEEEGDERTVEIKIDGLFCNKCPERLVHTLDGFQRRLEIISKPTLERPIIKLSYVPEPPGFTIRRILSAIEATDSTFTASIYHAPTLEERSRQIRKKHQNQLLKRLVFTVAVAIPTFILGIVYMNLIPDDNAGKMYLMKPWTSGLSRLQVALCLLATPVYFFGADIFHVRAIKEIRTMWKRGSRTPLIKRFTTFGSMNMLISLGTTVAYVSSVAQMIYAAVAKPDHFGDKHVYFDTVVFLTMFILAGRLIEAVSKSKTGDAVDALGKLRPTTAILVEKGKEEEVESRTVQVDLLDFGDTVRVPHGASPPADGVIVQGETSFDESSLTGESRLIKKSVGDDVFAGTVNKNAPVLMRVIGVGGSSMLDQIVKIVREGQTKRAPMERIADVMTAYFVPIITLIAITTWIVWMIIAQSGAVDGEMDGNASWVAFALQFAIAVFVVACPCGLALAAPTAIFVGGGLAAKHGVLAKGGGEAFEKASKIACVVFDKTGTLTQGGEPKITDSAIYPDVENVDDDKALKALAVLRAVEESSSHPIAKAIVAWCTGRTTEKTAISDLQEVPGKGMKATYDQDSEFLVGNEALMQEFGVIVTDKVSQLLRQWENEAKSIALAATKSAKEDAWTLAAALSISDPIRPEAIPIVKALRESGKQVWMISGDNPTTAIAVAKQVGIDPSSVLAGVLPSQKADKISYLQKTLKESVPGKEESTTRRAMVAMVGDGINDSPALTMADVGIAIGSGSDVAISSADFVLVTSDLRAVVTLLDLSGAVFRRIKFNFGWAVVFNICAVPIAAGVLYPIHANGERITLDPVWASLAMALSSISVVLSSLALRWKIPGVGFRVRTIAVPGDTSEN